jgi:hypothetical protein
VVDGGSEGGDLAVQETTTAGSASMATMAAIVEIRGGTLVVIEDFLGTREDPGVIVIDWSSA